MHTNEFEHQVSISAQKYIDLIQQIVTSTQYCQQFYWPITRPNHISYRIIFDLLQRILALKEITLAQDIGGQGTERPVTTGRGSWLDAIRETKSGANDRKGSRMCENPGSQTARRKSF